MATTSYKPEIEEVFEEDPFLHISTTGGSELGCFVTRKMLEIISKPPFLIQVSKTGDHFKELLVKLKDNYSKIVDVRGRGLMWGIEFEDEFTSLFFVLNSIKKGVFCDYCGNFKQVSKFLPPLIVTKEDINEIGTRIESTLKEL